MPFCGLIFHVFSNTKQITSDWMLKNFYHPQSISGKQHTTPNAKALQTQQENGCCVSFCIQGLFFFEKMTMLWMSQVRRKCFKTPFFCGNLGFHFSKPIKGGDYNLKYQLHKITQTLEGPCPPCPTALHISQLPPWLVFANPIKGIIFF